MKYHQLFKIILFLYCFNATICFADKQKPDLLLANIYSPDIQLQHYWVSEKLDGVRAYWNGKNLVSRQGNIFQAPKWFVAPYPRQHWTVNSGWGVESLSRFLVWFGDIHPMKLTGEKLNL